MPRDHYLNRLWTACPEAKRRSGDPYITHPVAVATILAGLGTADDQLLCAAILHDTVEDTPYTMPALRHDFGPAIAAMVAGHMALDHLGQLQRPGAAQVVARDRVGRRRGRRDEAGRPAA